jgi:hypothetical protein
MSRKTIETVILSREELLAIVAEALDQLWERLAGRLVMTHGDPDEELDAPARNALFVIQGVHVESESCCLWVDVRPATPVVREEDTRCLLPIDLRERDLLSEGVFLVTVKKEYRHVHFGGTHVIYGVLPVLASSQDKANRLVDAWIADETLKTNDPRLIWNKLRLKGYEWELVAGSLGRVQKEKDHA